MSYFGYEDFEEFEDFKEFEDYDDFECEPPYMPDFPYDLEATVEIDPWETFVYDYLPLYQNGWENEIEFFEQYETAQEAEEDFWEREYYSKLPSAKKENAGWWNDFGFSRTYSHRYEGKSSVAKHRALRKARKETRSFDRHREIDEAVSEYIKLVSWEDIFALETWLNA